MKKKIIMLETIRFYVKGIREEIRHIENGKADRDQNVLKLAPHTLKQICSDEWSRPYSRKLAAYPMVIQNYIITYSCVIISGVF